MFKKIWNIYVNFSRDQYKSITHSFRYWTTLFAVTELLTTIVLLPVFRLIDPTFWNNTSYTNMFILVAILSTVAFFSHLLIKSKQPRLIPIFWGKGEVELRLPFTSTKNAVMFITNNLPKRNKPIFPEDVEILRRILRTKRVDLPCPTLKLLNDTGFLGAPKIIATPGGEYHLILTFGLLYNDLYYGIESAQLCYVPATTSPISNYYDNHTKTDHPLLSSFQAGSEKIYSFSFIVSEVSRDELLQKDGLTKLLSGNPDFCNQKEIVAEAWGY